METQTKIIDIMFSDMCKEKKLIIYSTSRIWPHHEHIETL
jgi:hypothetical protein